MIINREKMSHLNRRSFIKVASAFVISSSLTGIAQESFGHPNTTISRNGSEILIQTTVDGKIAESLDDGRSWQVCFEPEQGCIVQRVSPTSNGLTAQIQVNGLTFRLHSTDGRNWLG